MIAHSERFLIMIAICVAVVVLARAIQPLINSVGLHIGLIGTVVGAICSAGGLLGILFAAYATWAGWNQPSVPSNVSGQPDPFYLAMVGLVIALGAALTFGAVFAHRRRRANGAERSQSADARCQSAASSAESCSCAACHASASGFCFRLVQPALARKAVGVVGR